MTNEPTAYRVISEPSGSWHFARTKEDAEKIANNLLKYVNRCKRVRIQALGFLSEEVRNRTATTPEVNWTPEQHAAVTAALTGER